MDHARHARCRASTCRRWRPASSSSSTTCACPACCTARSSVRRRSARRSSRVDESLDRTHAGRGEGGRQEELRGRRGREAVAGDAGGGAARGDVDAGRRPAAAARTSTISCGQQPSRDAFVVNSGDVDETLAAPASVVKATYLHPYQMHGSMGTSCAVADVQGDKATIWSPTQSAYPTRKRRRRRCSAFTPDNVRVIFMRGAGLLRHQRRRHGLLRRGAPVAGGGQARCACSCHAQDEMALGELRLRVRRSISAPASTPTAASSRGTTRRGSPRAAAGPATTRRATSITGLLAGFEPAPFTPRPRRRTAGRIQQRQQRRAVLHCRPRRAATRGGTGTIASERVLTHTRRFAVLHRSAAVAVPAAEHLRARVLPRRSRGAGEGRSGRVPAASPRATRG